MTNKDPQLSPPDIETPADDGRTRPRDLGGHASGAVTVARRTAARIIARVPGTVDATRAGTHEATTALQALPDPMLRSLAASSVGLGAGFYLAGAPRLVVVAGMVPAMIMAAAIALRPVEPLVQKGADR